MTRTILTATTTFTGFKTVSGNKLRLLRFARLPLVDVGDLVVDPTGYTAGDLTIAYVGVEGVGYDDDFNPAYEDEFVVGELEATFKRTIPEHTASASDRSVNRKFARLAKFLGMKLLRNEQPEEAPAFQGARSFLVQGEDVVTGMERLDAQVGALSAPLDPDPAGVYTDIVALTINSMGQITNVATIGDDATHVVTRRQYIRKIPVVITSDLLIPATFVPVNLAAHVPSTAKTALMFLRVPDRMKHDRHNYMLETSVDGVNFIPVFYEQGGEDENGSDDYYGIGVQFTTRVIGSSFMIRNTGNDLIAYQWQATLIGYST